MSRPKRWYDADAGDALRVVRQSSLDDAYSLQRWRHARTTPSLGECLLYPLTDGPGLGLMFLFPPVLWVLSLPVFDFIAVLQPLTKSDWALGLFVVPVFIPMLVSFAMVVGYLFLFLGHVLVASAMGENDHPRWPEWTPDDVAEGIGRWIWALLMGAAVAGPPAFAYWSWYGGVDATTGVVMAALVVLGTGFTQMALAASLMHDTILAANPVTVVVAVRRIGWAYLLPTVVASVATLGVALGVYGLLYHVSRMWVEAVALWGFWLYALYSGMVVLRMVGLTYHAHAMELFWFRRRPKWATGTRAGRIYANS
ncbi:hypothetical protein [Paludisphaera mucosa]|uniref:DUF4013 domain-containing protein n=1 Tax=Paludisphaera mucosa TaxID=3030827 RepID=A0ABT6FAP2_9BACT|nr:hypothetical protein [Paludisphaera mucosa]MDG3004556.1 hypothetical protein [Paludisphaera mucosa]